MHRFSQIPAVQLQSVAPRYRAVRPHPWQATRSSFTPVAATANPLAGLDQEDIEVRTRRVEAILFLAREPLNARKLSQHAGLADGTEARTLVLRLNKQYDDLGRAFRVEQVAGGYQFLTRPQFGNWLRRLEHTPAQTRLSAPAMETLAVVAYRQPVPRADVEAIRGVSCGEILRQLMERDLVRIGGRGEELGRPYLYATTQRFLRIFGLRNLDQLPRSDVLRNAAIPNKTQLQDSGS